MTPFYTRFMQNTQDDPELQSLRRRAAIKREKLRKQKERDDGVKLFLASVPPDQLQQVLERSGDQKLIDLGYAFDDPAFRVFGFVALCRRFWVSSARLEKARGRYNRAIKGESSHGCAGRPPVRLNSGKSMPR
jgi:hypothetical protein